MWICLSKESITDVSKVFSDGNVKVRSAKVASLEKRPTPTPEILVTSTATPTTG